MMFMTVMNQGIKRCVHFTTSFFAAVLCGDVIASSTFVIPAGLEVREAAGGSGVIHVRNREQTVYGSNHFPAHPIWIEGLRFRPNVHDGTPGNSFTTTISNLQINLSTTLRASDALSATFSSNSGPDEVVAFNGPLTVSSQFSGPSGGPKDFDIIIPLQQRFRYDPSAGNLLLDVRDFSGEATCYIDAENSTSDRASRVLSQNVTATIGSRDTGANVVEVQYSPAEEDAPGLVVPAGREFIEAAGGSGVLDVVNREQTVYDASQFPAGPILIREILMRPSIVDGTPGRAFANTISNIQIHLSTTAKEPDALSPTFAENRGTDNTLVYAGSLSLSSQFTGPTNGPKHFDIRIPLQTPFRYDPAAGNLLLDVQNFSGEHTSIVDAENSSSDLSSRVVAPGNADATTGAPDTGADVLKLIFSPAGTNVPPSFAPRISAIMPVAGPVGSNVAIEGERFSPVSAQNTVYFGAVQATVTAATSNSLTAVVPHGATYGPVSVTVDGLIAYSSAAFTVTFDSSGLLDAGFLAPRLDLNAADGPIHTSLGDIDGDGRPDLIVANLHSESISVYRNTSSPGSLSAASFAPKLDFPAASSVQRLVLGDVDGDGRLDVAAACAGNNTVSVFRNTSTTGNISFGPRADFPVGNYPHSIAVGDLDRDGRLDIATANFYSDTISVLRNTVTTGVDANSFASQVQYEAGDGPHSIAIGDLNGDGRPDIACANLDSVTTSIFRNTSAPGSLSFIGSEVSGGGNHVAIGDLDRDGKLDLAVGYWRGYNLFLLRNTSSGADILFAPRRELAVGANTHTISIGDLDGDGRPDLSVVAEQPSFLKVYQNFSHPGSFNFGSPVEFSAGWNAVGVSAGDIDLDGKPDVTFCNFYDDTLSVYRNVIADRAFSLSRQFGTTNNPQGPWSYGWENTLGGAFTLFPALGHSSGENGVPVIYWAKTLSGPASVYHNHSSQTTTSDGGEAVYPPGAVWFFPGVEGSTDNLGVIRFTTPTAAGGTYRLTTSVRSYLDGASSGDTDFHVLRNGTEVFGESLPPRSGTTYTSVITLTGGDTVDFAIGRGADDRVAGSGLKIEAHLVLLSTNDSAPTILVQPASQSADVADTVTFSVVGSGSPPLSYQWLFNGGTISGATSSSLTLSDVQASAAGDYSVRVANAVGSVTSLVAVLTVNPPGSDLALVVPRGLESREASGGSGVLNQVNREQTVYAGSHFPNHPILIEEIHFRPSIVDGTPGRAFSNTISRLQVAFSTTQRQPDNLSPVFATNTGPDVQVVFDGPATLSSRFTGPSNGPKAFDIILRLSRPFRYNPAAGNLLMDIRNFSAQPTSIVDAENSLADSASRVVAPNNANAAVGNPDTGADVLKIVYSVASSPGLVVPAGREFIEAAGGSGVLDVVNREQTVYDASQFPAGPILIREILMRPSIVDGTPGRAFAGTISNIQIHLSTTQKRPDALSSIFAQNRGADNTLVYGGSLSLSSQFSGPANGPKEFDIRIPLQTPFPYDPAAGNLLLDVQNFSGEHTSIVDAENSSSDLSSRLVAPGNASATVGAPDTGADVLKIVYSPVDVPGLVVPAGREFIEAAGGSGVLDVVNREQTVYDASQFPTGPILIHEILMRPNIVDGTRGRPFTNTISNIQIHLSTTPKEPDALSSTFAENRGADNRLVYGGSLTLSSRFTGPTNGPKDFDIRIPLQQPFRYDPAAGNLLLDVQNFSGERTSIVDAENSSSDLSSRLVAPGSANAIVGAPDTGADVLKLIYSPAGTNTPPVPGTHNLSRDFSSTTNPKGVWSYGWQNTLGGTHIVYPTLGHSSGENGVPVIYWAKTLSGPSSVYHNPSAQTTTSDGGQAVYPPGAVWFFPGAEGQADNFGVIRFTTPNSGPGTYQLGTVVRSYLDGPRSGDTDFHVLRNGIELFGQNLAPRSGTNYTNTLTLAAGDTIDFAIGRGADNRVDGSGLKIEVQLTRLSTNMTAPTILVQPADQTAETGGSATFSVVASGSPPLSYQWLFDGEEISGATSSSLTLFNVEASAAGDYSVRVANPVGSVTSVVAVLTVNPPGSDLALVVPRGLEAREASGGSGVLNQVNREQTVYAASHFPNHAIWINELRFRPSIVDGTRGRAFSNTISNLRITLSTTQRRPDNLSSIFATNLGPDRAVVLNGPITLSSRFTGPTNGPKDFDIIIPLMHPFRYDPAQGNLLMDIQNFSGELTSIIDAENSLSDLASRVVAPNSASASWGNPDTGADVIRIGYSLADGPALVVPAGREFIEAAGGSDPIDRAIREQTVYDASQFPAGPILIHEILMRPNIVDGTRGQPFTNTISNILIHLSTSQKQPDALSSTFAENRGPDNTLVYGGSLTLSSQFTGPTNGPKDFDIRIPLQTPFRYDPVGGNLLVDVQNFSGERTSFVDAENSSSDLSSRVASPGNPNAIVGTPDTGALVLKLIYSAAGTNQPPVQSYDLSRDFSTNSNPNGVWSYGWQNTIGGPLTLFTYPGTAYGDNGVRVVYWQRNSFEPATVFHNPSSTTTTSDGGQGVYPPGTTWFGAGIEGHQDNYSVIRFTLPSGAAGNYRLETAVRSYLDGSLSGDTDFHVLLNGDEIFGQFLAPRSGTGYTNTISLTAGDTVDFVAGRGADNISHASGLKIEAYLSPAGTNEPPVAARTFVVGTPPARNEGEIIPVPVTLVSTGDVGGFTLVLTYNPDYLSVADLEWGSALADAFKQWNDPRQGQLRMVVGTSGTPLPAGTQAVATVRFRARTVTETVTSPLRLQVLDVSSATGDILAQGTAVINGEATILAIGSTDNNANNIWDVGDAALLLRLLAGVDTFRSWDLDRNDRNQNDLLDSGDVTKILRIATGLDPQPGGGAPPAEAAESQLAASGSAGFLEGERAVLSPARIQGISGQIIRFQVRLEDVQSTISGAAFTLNYPANALRLTASQPYRTGSLVPGNSMAIWNAATPGQLRMAVSSDSAWANSEGVLAEVTFEVLPGVSSQHLWPISLSSLEVTPDGYEPRGLATQDASVIGRAATGGRLSVPQRGASGEFTFSFTGDVGANYAIQVSSDLVNWETLTNVVNSTGAVEVIDPDAATHSRRFYRTVPVE